MTTQKTYFITGTNRGIGLELVKQLSEESSNTVVATTRNVEKSTKLTDLAKDRENVKVISLDIADENSIHSVASQLKELRIKSIDSFIQNAALYSEQAYNHIIDVEYSYYEKLYKTNALGPIELFKVLKPFLDQSSTKQVVFVSSLAGSIGGLLPFSTSAYGQTKAALNHSVRTLAFELKPEGYTILAVHPGAVMTENSTDMYGVLSKKFPEISDFIDAYGITPEESAKSLIKVWGNLVSGEGSDKFLSYDGSELPW